MVSFSGIFFISLCNKKNTLIPDPPSVRPYSCRGWILQRHLRGAELHQDEVQEHPHLQPRGRPAHGGRPKETQEEGTCGLDLPTVAAKTNDQER